MSLRKNSASDHRGRHQTTTASPVRESRQYSPLDRLLMGAQRGLDVLAAAPKPFAGPARARVDYPATASQDAELDDAAKRHAAGLMRVNHAGEIAAQALYRGQALVARDPAVREQLLQAAAEERAHLEWCEARLTELGERPSHLAPFWYAASVAIGAGTALAGDRVSLGFVEETERQVVEHLEGHLRELPKGDQRSRAIVRQMRDDEQRHGADAVAAGAAPLPPPVKRLMAKVADVMKFGAYRF